MMNIPHLTIFFVISILVKDSIGGDLRQCYFVKPQNPNRNVTFWLQTSPTLQKPILLDPEGMNCYYFKRILPVVILIHEYGGDRNALPNSNVGVELMKTESRYVISMDYSPLASAPCYLPWAVENAKAAALVLAKFIDGLIDKRCVARIDLHIVGFGMGSHVAGIAANYAKHKLHHITSLSPPILGFGGVDVDSRLDSKDADFVDVYHTDTKFYGLLEPIGDADIYVNAELDTQPGCVNKVFGIFEMCSHNMACAFYAHSISSRSSFWSHRCGSYLEYLMDDCGKFKYHPHFLVGFHISKRARGSLFVNTTNPSSPSPKGRY